MMKRAAFALAPLAVLAACGDGVPFTGEARAAYDQCISGGGEAARCTCVTKELQEKLPAEEFTKAAKGDLAAMELVTIAAMAAADHACAPK